MSEQMADIIHKPELKPCPLCKELKRELAKCKSRYRQAVEAQKWCFACGNEVKK
jgi:hypothetical protein